MEVLYMSVFHLHVSKADLQGATLAILPGDPARVERIAQGLASPKFLSSSREFTLYLGFIGDKAVVVCSTGIGGPSTSIAVEELAQLGVTDFLRIGTTGAIQPHINVGDVIVTTGSVRLDGASSHFAPLEFPAVANHDITSCMVDATKSLELPVHIGVTASSDTFYPGQERYDTATGRVVGRFKGSLKGWQEMGVLNFEMESATLLTMCASSGWRAGCVAGVIINRTRKETPDEATAKSVEANSIRVVLEAAKRVLAD